MVLLSWHETEFIGEMLLLRTEKLCKILRHQEMLDSWPIFFRLGMRRDLKILKYSIFWFTEYFHFLLYYNIFLAPSRSFILPMNPFCCWTPIVPTYYLAFIYNTEGQLSMRMFICQRSHVQFLLYKFILSMTDSVFINRKQISFGLVWWEFIYNFR